MIDRIGALSVRLVASWPGIIDIAVHQYSKYLTYALWAYSIYDLYDVAENGTGIGPNHGLPNPGMILHSTNNTLITPDVLQRSCRSFMRACTPVRSSSALIMVVYSSSGVRVPNRALALPLKRSVIVSIQGFGRGRIFRV